MFECPAYVKIELYCVLAALIGIGLTALHHHIYAQGYDAGVAAQQNSDEKALQHNEKVFQSAEKGVIAVENSAAPAASAAQAHTTVVVKTVEKIVHDHPDFAALHRPDDLEQLRLDQIARLRALAGPRAEPAASSTTPE